MALKMLLNILQLWILMCPSVRAGDSSVNENITSLILRYEEMYCGSSCLETTTPRSEDSPNSIPARAFLPSPNDTLAPPPDYLCSTCFCDSECRRFGDCCSDLYIGKGDFEFQCEEIISATGTSISLFVVTKCSPRDEKYSEELSSKCNTHSRLNYDEEVLVSSGRENRTSLTFRNKYCARCHGYEDFQPWTVDISCKDLPDEISDISDPADIFTRLQKSQVCKVGQKKPKDISTRSCSAQSLVSDCNVTGAWQDSDSDIEAACHAYTHVFIGQYRNVFCYICNENENMQFEFYLGGGSLQIVSLTGILQFEEDQAERTTPRTKCPREEYDDIFTDRCLKILCPPFYQLHKRECTFPTGLLDRPFTLQYFVQLHLIPMHGDYLHLRNDTLNPLPGELQNYYRLQGTLNGWHLHKLVVRLYWENSSLVHGAKTEDVLHHTTNDEVVCDDGRHGNISHPDEQYIISRIDIDLYASYSREDYANFFESFSNLLFEEFSISVEGSNITYRSVYESMLPQTRHTTIPTQFLFQDADDFNFSRPFSPKYVKRNCAQVLYPQSNYTLFSNNSVMLEDSNIFISGDNYTLTEELGILVCLSTVEDLRRRYEERMGEKRSTAEQGYDILTILTVISLVFSMFFLSLSFLVYVMLSALRTLPGCNLMFLMSSLFLAQGLFLFGAGAIENRVVCKIMGVLIHYFWMVTFAWMNVCTFHVFRVFRNILSSVKLSDDKRIILLKYGVFSYLTPAVIVAITIVANYFLSRKSTIGYSDSHANCFLNPGLITLVAFGIPTVFTVVCTGAFFVCTVAALRRASADRARVGKKETKVILNLVKLSSATGLSWVFGLLGSLFSVEAFQYVFVILAAGQGVLIFLSFVLNKRVYKMMLRRCCPKQRVERQRPTSYTISGTSKVSSDSIVTSV
ncbi:uncharacterized protein LOC124146241 [Haliotis rufescens]|uniref:uncharacterized protein LOC124146241 n=1 Tax=Haliotis rufescens TaxID=6454 RepID=UPI00201E7AC5|nr:uncharacterized protein LOC124146241 [Haliotis rufescens]